jgi:hypothetical protein
VACGPHMLQQTTHRTFWLLASAKSVLALQVQAALPMSQRQGTAMAGAGICMQLFECPEHVS